MQIEIGKDKERFWCMCSGNTDEATEAEKAIEDILNDSADAIQAELHEIEVFDFKDCVNILKVLYGQELRNRDVTFVGWHDESGRHGHDFTGEFCEGNCPAEWENRDNIDVIRFPSGYSFYFYR